MIESQNLTGREHHILVKALALAIETIEVLPSHLQALSDQQDMKEMLDKLVAGDEMLRMYAQNAKEAVQALTSGE